MMTERRTELTSFTATAHLLNRKAAALYFTRVFTVCLQYALRNIGKKHSLPYQSNNNVLFFQLCVTFNQGTIYREKLVSKILGGSVDPAL